MSGFPCWVAFNADDFPVAFARADYCSLIELQDEEEGGPWNEYRVELITDQNERHRLLDMHKGSTSGSMST